MNYLNHDLISFYNSITRIQVPIGVACFKCKVCNIILAHDAFINEFYTFPQQNYIMVGNVGWESYNLTCDEQLIKNIIE